MRKFNFNVPFTRHHYPKAGTCVSIHTIYEKCANGWDIQKNGALYVINIKDYKTLSKYMAVIVPLYKDIYFVLDNSRYNLSAVQRAKVEDEHFRLKREFYALKRDEAIIEFCCGEIFTDVVYPESLGFDGYDQLRDHLLALNEDFIVTQEGEEVRLVDALEGQTIATAFKAKYEEIKNFADILAEIK